MLKQIVSIMYKLSLMHYFYLKTNLSIIFNIFTLWSKNLGRWLNEM